MGERPESLAELREQRVYERAVIEYLFGVTRWQVQHWVDTGVLKRLPETGKRIRVSGVEILRFAREVIGVEPMPESATPSSGRRERCVHCDRPKSWCACADEEEKAS